MCEKKWKADNETDENGIDWRSSLALAASAAWRRGMASSAYASQ